MEVFKSDLSGLEFPIVDRVSINTVRHTILNILQAENPNITDESFISRDELNYYRQKYMAEFLFHELGELSEEEKTVLHSITRETTLADEMNYSNEPTADLKFSQRLADKIASFGGSWTFIISFGVFLGVWILTNILWLSFSKTPPLDAYPFIFLNLILSCLAAIQAPVIMMSQNRQEEKDRQRARQDYMVNLKSELEIRMLHEKIDHMILDQQQELLSTQKSQTETLALIMNKLNSNHT